MASIEDDDVDAQSRHDFYLKCMSKCANYRNETKKEKQKQVDLHHEIAREFGNSPEVHASVSHIKSKIAKDLAAKQEASE